MKTLNTPITINQMQLRNRLVMPPMATNKSDVDGKVSDGLCLYYAEKSSGGYIGLIITEHSYINPDGKASSGQLSISKDQDIAGLHRLTNIAHKNGVKMIAQLSHAGSAARPDNANAILLSASAVKSPGHERIAKAMESSDIQKVIDDFVSAALRAQKSGYDGVEIHSAHGYLLNQFYSPLTNKRTDSYNGNSIDGRIRLHLEIIHAIRKAVGTNYPIALRLGACDYTHGGSTIQDSITAAVEFERSGIDLLDISGGFCGYTNPNSKEQGYFSEITEEIKKHVSIPVLLTGGIKDKDAANRLLMENKADMIGVGRSILKDSTWAKRAMQE